MSIQLNNAAVINARHNKGLSQQEVVDLGKALGFRLSLRTVSKAENGLAVHPATARALSNVLGVAIRKLIVPRREEYANSTCCKEKSKSRKRRKAS